MATSTYLLAIIAMVVCFSSVMEAKSAGKCIFCLGQGSACNKGNETTHQTMDCSTFAITGPTGTTTSLDQIATDHLEPQAAEMVQSFFRNITEQQKKAKAPKLVCLKYTMEHDDIKKPIVLKSCAPEKIFNQDICDWGDSLISLAEFDTDECNTCEKNYCNGASGFAHNFMFLFLVPLVYQFFA